jgi:predicted molibdopterin-dependent oxidoreductase YjgC
MVESNSIGAVNSEVNNIEQAGCILVTGANVTQSHPVLGIKIKKAVENGAKLIVISPQETGLCRMADIWLNPYPGTDLSLIMGICSVIVEEELHDSSFIGEYSEKFDDFRESLEDFSPGRVERITGVARDKVEEAARIFANGKPSAILWDTGITQYSQGTNNVLGLINMSILTGNIKHPSGLVPLWGQNNALGACTMGCLPDFYPWYQPVADPKNRKRLEGAWGKNLSPVPGLTLTEILDAVSEGKIKALYIIGTDIVTNVAPVRKAKDVLKKAKFIVFQDMFLNETAKFADVVLPAASFAEKDGTFTNAERLIRKVSKAMDPIGDSRADWQIMCELAKRAGAKGFDFHSAEEIMSEISSVAAGSAAQMKRFRFTSLHYKLPAEVADIDYPLILTFKRDLYSMGFLSKKSEGLNDLSGKDLVYINPKDAADFEIEDSETVKVISRWGDIIGEARLTGSVPPGLISMNLIGEKGNQLLNPALDEVSKTPELKICAVRVAAQ